MPSRWFALCIIVLVVGVLVPVPAVGDSTADHPRIEVVAPNPVSHNNIGEFVVIDPGERTSLRGWTLTDGNQAVTLQTDTVDGPVAVTASPSVTELITEYPVITWDGFLQLAADGGTLTLLDPEGEHVDSVTYPRTPLDYHWVRNGGRVESMPAEYQSLTFDPHNGTTVQPYVLPDSPSIPRDTLANASDRLWLAGYEFTDPEIRDVVRERYAAGVDVRVLVDGTPVGGQSADEIRTLDLLDDDGIPVRVLVGSRDRFRFHHPKYAVVDEHAILMTENWKRAGSGGSASRGWGVKLLDSEPTNDLAHIFRTDFQARDAVSWSTHRDEISGTDVEPANGSYAPVFTADPLPAERIQLVVTPTAAEYAHLDVIRAADRRIDVQQVQIGDENFPLLQELVRAAERGVQVRILLDGEWYVRDRNEALASELNDVAARNDLPLEVRLVDPAGRFGKIHTKGMVVDKEVTVVGSMNWNNVSMTQNREVIAIIESEPVAAFFSETFEHDWESPGTPVPVGVVAATIATWLGAGLLARRFVSFDPPT